MKGCNRWLAAILIGAVAARAAAVLVLQSHHVPRSTYEHGEIAASLVAGRGFSMHFLGADGPTSQQAPVYPFVVAAAYVLGGVEDPRALLLLQLGQSLLGGLMVLGVYRLASRVAPGQKAVAIGSALVAAFHPTLVYAATHVQVAGLAATIVAWTLVYAMDAAGTNAKGPALITGALLGLGALTDPILGLVGIGVLVALWLGRPDTGTFRYLATRLALIFSVATMAIAPWVLRNAWIHGEFVPIKSTFGYAFWQGNCAISEGTDKVVRPSVETVMERSTTSGDLATYNGMIWKARHTAGYIDDIAMSKEFKAKLGAMAEPERSRFLFRMALDDIRDDPARYAGLCLRRFRYFWLFDETNPRSRVLVYRASHLALSVMAVVGLIAAAADVRRRILPMAATAAAVSVFHALTIVSARFHIPVEPLMAVCAGIAAARTIEALGRLTPSRSVGSTGRLEHVGIVGRLG